MSDLQPENRWPVWKLALLFYPFAAGAVAINLFMLGLIGVWLGLPAIAPTMALCISAALGVPATWLTGRWMRTLMDEADGQDTG